MVEPPKHLPHRRASLLLSTTGQGAPRSGPRRARGPGAGPGEPGSPGRVARRRGPSSRRGTAQATGTGRAPQAVAHTAPRASCPLPSRDCHPEVARCLDPPRSPHPARLPAARPRPFSQGHPAKPSTPLHIWTRQQMFKCREVKMYETASRLLSRAWRSSQCHARRWRALGHAHASLGPGCLRAGPRATPEPR